MAWSEGTNALPKDQNDVLSGGLWDATGSVFRHFRGDSANGMDVDVTRLPALPAGTNNIGDVDVLTLPADPLGANADAVVAAGATGSISAKLRRVTQALEDLKTLIVLGAGSAVIGAVKIDQTTPGTTDRVTVGGTTTSEVTPTVSTSPAYTAGDAVGGKMSFTSAARVSGGTGIVQSVRVVDQAKQSAALDLILFAADPSGTTVTDNGALDVADADMDKIVGHVSIAATDYCALNDNSFATKYGIGLPFKLASGTTLYGVLVARGTPTFAATTDIVVELGLLQD